MSKITWMYPVPARTSEIFIMVVAVIVARSPLTWTCVLATIILVMLFEFRIDLASWIAVAFVTVLP